MKRRDLERHLREYGCILAREGAKHSVYVNQKTGGDATLPRHSEINTYLARELCKQLSIPPPRGR